MRNYGLLQEKQARAKDWVFGGITGILTDKLELDGSWDEWLPIYEPQSSTFDTMSCVTFSALNCLETLYKRKYKDDVNFSDRFIAKSSNTTLSGNYLSVVADAIVNYGLVDESLWPFEARNWTEYMKDIPTEVYDSAAVSRERFKINWEWVLDGSTDALKEALQYSPIQVTVYAWQTPVNDVYQRTEIAPNHAVMLYGYRDNEYWLIYDHYSKNIKKLAWDFNFGHRLRYNIENNMPEKKYADNLLVQLVEAPGGFGMTLDGKLVIDDLSKLQAAWILRNNGDIKGKTLPMLKADWDLLPKINLKKEAL